MIASYLFVFGRTPLLSYKELISLLPDLQLEKLTDYAYIARELDDDPQALIKTLGGTVTIAKVLGEVESISTEYLTSLILKNSNQASITFSLSSLAAGFTITSALLGQIKKNISNQGVSCRYVEHKEGHTMSAIVQKGQKVTEYILAKSESGRFILSQTVAYQDIATWVRREYGRPFADPKRGMLPPKVARMVINIANSFVSATSSPNKVLLDPFCGMGTIVAEAVCMGWNAIGSDISQEVVTRAQKNLNWTQAMFSEAKDQSAEIFVADATHVSEKVSSSKIQAIVTEPFLGSPNIANQELPNNQKIQNTIKGLEKLYIGCLKDWYKILSDSGVVIIALPKISYERREYFVKKVIDSCEMLGYSIVAGPYTYSRPKAVVSRNFYILQKKTL